MFLVAIWQLETADSGLKVTHLRAGDLPVTLISPGGNNVSDRRWIVGCYHVVQVEEAFYDARLITADSYGGH